MPMDTNGTCPNCEKRPSRVGDPCPTEVCVRKGYHFIPKAWYDSAREYAARKHKSLDPLLGRCIDRYLLAGLLGEGGMGAVYLAYQRPLNREVALKVISGMELTDAAIARFEREARAIALLDHANIRKLYDYGIGDLEFRIPYMALEYVRHGRTLRKALPAIEDENGGRVPFEALQAIFRQVLNALGAAHEQGIVHRDMKPDNVMIAPEHGNPYMVKILDFGLAKAVSDLSGFDEQVTSSGVILGTPAYMAPEQTPGRGARSVDGRADLYAVAVMLFEVFTGVRPFAGDSPLAILVKKTDRAFDPLNLPEARGLPEPLRAFLRRGLAPDPEERFQTAAEMLDAFEAAAVGGPFDLATTTRIPIPISSRDSPLTPASPPAYSPAPGVDTAGRARPNRADATLVTSPRRRLGWVRWLALASFAAVAAGGLAYLLGASGRPPPGNPAPPPRPAALAPPLSLGTATATTRDTERDAGVVSPPDTALDSGASGVASPSPTPDVASRHRFVIRTDPPGARVLVEGRTLGTSPASYEFWSSQGGLSREVEVVATRAGFRDARRRVVLSQAVEAGEVVLVLERVPPRTVTPPRPRPPRPPRPTPDMEAPTKL